MCAVINRCQQSLYLGEEQSLQKVGLYGHLSKRLMIWVCFLNKIALAVEKKSNAVKIQFRKSIQAFFIEHVED